MHGVLPVSSLAHADVAIATCLHDRDMFNQKVNTASQKALAYLPSQPVTIVLKVLNKVGT